MESIKRLVPHAETFLINLVYAMMTSKNIHQIIEKIDSEYNLDDHYRVVVCFMVECLSSIESFFPDVAIHGAKVAQSFCAGVASEDQITEARINCWKYLDENDASLNVDEPIFCAVRAVICALYFTPPSEDISEILNWFLKMMQSVNDAEDYLIEKIAKYFPRAIVESLK